MTEIDGASGDVGAALVVDFGQGKHAGDTLAAGLCRDVVFVHGGLCELVELVGALHGDRVGACHGERVVVRGDYASEQVCAVARQSDCAHRRQARLVVVGVVVGAGRVVWPEDASRVKHREAHAACTELVVYAFTAALVLDAGDLVGYVGVRLIGAEDACAEDAAVKPERTVIEACVHLEQVGTGLDDCGWHQATATLIGPLRRLY